MQPTAYSRHRACCVRTTLLMSVQQPRWVQVQVRDVSHKTVIVDKVLLAQHIFAMKTLLGMAKDNSNICMGRYVECMTRKATWRLKSLSRTAAVRLHLPATI